MASFTGRFLIYFFVPCLLRDSDNEEFSDNILTAILPRCVGCYAARLGTGKLTLQSCHRRQSFVDPAMCTQYSCLVDLER